MNSLLDRRDAITSRRLSRQHGRSTRVNRRFHPSKNVRRTFSVGLRRQGATTHAPDLSRRHLVANRKFDSGDARMIVRGGLRGAVVSAIERSPGSGAARPEAVQQDDDGASRWPTWGLAVSVRSGSGAGSAIVRRRRRRGELRLAQRRRPQLHRAGFRHARAWGDSGLAPRAPEDGPHLPSLPARAGHRGDVPVRRDRRGGGRQAAVTRACRGLADAVERIARGHSPLRR